MRLIDADAFEKFIEEKYKDGESTDDIKDQVLFDLSYQPTAYDVEKVVEQLKEKSVETIPTCAVDGYSMTEEENMVFLDDAIDIVRGGRE